MTPVSSFEIESESSCGSFEIGSESSREADTEVKRSRKLGGLSWLELSLLQV